MDKNQVLSRILPYIVALAAFAAVSMVCFSPQFAGKSLVTNDVTQYRGMSKDIHDHYEAYGEDPQWTGNLFGGMPGQLIWMKYRGQLTKSIEKAFDFMGRPASSIFIAMSAFFIMLLMFGVNPWTGIIPSLAYGLSTYFFIIIGAGHETKMVALAWVPLMLGAVFYTYRRNMWLGAALTALFAAIEIGAGHPQITYYFVMVLLAFWINEGITAYKDKLLARFAKATGLLAVAAMLAVGATIMPLWYTAEYSKYSTRGGTELTGSGDQAAGSGLDLEYATAWSYGKMESFNMYIPDFMGGSSFEGFSDDGPVAGALAGYGARDLASQLPSYWGDQPGTAGPTYIGAVVIFLCVLGLFMLRGRTKWWIIVISLIALMLAWGSNLMWFTKLFFNFFPGYDKFRTVAMILVILEWSVPFVAALILSKLWRGGADRQQVRKSVKYSLYITGGVALFFLLLGGSMFSFSAPTDATLASQGIPGDVIEAMRQERAGMMRSDALRSLIFVLLTAAVVWFWNSGKLKKGWAIAALAVLVCADLIPVNFRYFGPDQFVEARNDEIRPNAANLRIMEDQSLGYRVFNLTGDPFSDARTSYFHRSVGGYHGAKLQRYQDIIERHLRYVNMNVVNMLNVKYFIVADESGQLAVQVNPDANGPAWFVDEVVIADNADREIEALDEIDTKTRAVVDKRFSELLTAIPYSIDSTAWITMTDYKPNYQKYEYYSPEENVAVFSEIYYEKGWTAYIDGAEAPHFRADYILRGMVLPAGEHTVEFRYAAENYNTLSAITLVCSILILLGVAAAAVAAIKCNKNKRDEDAGQQEIKA